MFREHSRNKAITTTKASYLLALSPSCNHRQKKSVHIVETPSSEQRKYPAFNQSIIAVSREKVSVFTVKGYKPSRKTECIAGVTTFLTMAYIMVVNPLVLSAAKVPFAQA